MAFRAANFKALANFNSATSAMLLNEYTKEASKDILESREDIKSKAFAPSSFRCKRHSWFRLRGVEPDPLIKPDLQLDFTAQIGTACHELIQSRLSKSPIWVDVEQYIQANYPTYKIEKSGYECRVSVECPPVRFACDGILYMNDEYYLLEIKSVDHSTFLDLVAPKDYHIDQVKCYGTLLNVRKVLFMYIDRQFGDVKCYETSISASDMNEVDKTFRIVIDYVEKNIAPEALPVGDRMCTSNMCAYYHKCKEWGR